MKKKFRIADLDIDAKFASCRMVFFCAVVWIVAFLKPSCGQDQYVSSDSANSIEVAPLTLSKGLALTSSDQQPWSISGTLKGKTGTIVLKPRNGKWDISTHSFFRLNVANNGKGLVWIRGRLDNHNAQDWANSTASSAFVMPGESAILGFPFPRPWEQNDAPEIFNEMSAKPNGHRTHWKRFDPKRVIACRLQIQSANDEISLKDIDVCLERPYGMQANQKLATLPFLDRFGQTRNQQWETKISAEKVLKQRDEQEQKRLANDPGPKSYNRFGGWADGPLLEATGFFRVVKNNGKWWFVDPEGRLFISHGINTIGFRASTPIGGRSELFEWLPEKSTPIFKAMVRKQDYRNAISFIRGNVYRTFEENWMEQGHDRIRKRLRSWGVNTVGAWSDKGLINNQSVQNPTPYTAILHVWRQKETRIDKDTPDPYAADFAERVAVGLQTMVDQRGHDPWCVGVFIDNEIDWHDDLVQRVFAGPPTQPAKLAFVDLLKEKYGDVDKLNSIWLTEFVDWNDLLKHQDLKVTKSRVNDFKWLYSNLAECYYKICCEKMRQVMPNHLYLGSRIHKCPSVVAQQCAKHVDVYSTNSYVDLANVGSLPKNVDKPVLVAEFHFAALGRGLGVGLSPVGDRLQRCRAFSAFVLNGLRDPKVVGTHWFAYADQSAAGRPYENYQIGFVDVTDTPYPLLPKMSRRIAERMYEIRSRESFDLLPTLAKILEN